MLRSTHLSTILSLILLSRSTTGFAPNILPLSSPLTTQQRNPLTGESPTLLCAKKKGKNTAGKGFSKTPPPQPAKASETQQQQQQQQQQTMEASSMQQSTGFSSIEGGSSSPPQTQPIAVDPNLPTEERTKEILKQKYGLRTYEEQQGDIRAAEKIVENKKRMQKIRQMSDEEFDIFQVIPAPLIKAIDTFLKVGLSISTVLFILAGIGITIEAWAVATKNTIPEDLDHFIVNTIEPNFTPGLFVLLGFSISLGVFATAQLGSGSSAYQEKP